MSAFEDDRWYTTSDPELLLIGSPNALALRRSRGEAPRFHRIGRRILYRGVDLNGFLEECAVEPTARRGCPISPESGSVGTTLGGPDPASAGAA